MSDRPLIPARAATDVTDRVSAGQERRGPRWPRRMHARTDRAREVLAVVSRETERLSPARQISAVLCAAGCGGAGVSVAAPQDPGRRAAGGGRAALVRGYGSSLGGRAEEVGRWSAARQAVGVLPAASLRLMSLAAQSQLGGPLDDQIGSFRFCHDALQPHQLTMIMASAGVPGHIGCWGAGGRGWVSGLWPAAGWAGAGRLADCFGDGRDDLAVRVAEADPRAVLAPGGR